MANRGSQVSLAEKVIPNDHPFKVVCSQCGKTVLESGENGAITEVICDKCEGIS